MSRFALLLLLAICSTPALAQTPAPVPPPSLADPRLQMIRYDANQVVRLKVATNFQSTVIFGSDERVENVAIGDSDAWQVTLNQRGDALFLKPQRSNGVTNMTVITDLRVYNFELSSTFSPAPDTPFTVRFLYSSAEAQQEAPVPQPGIGRYRLSGSRSLRPVTVSDDGIRTTIEWRANQAIPAIFALDDQGAEILLEGHMRDGRFVIDTLHRALVFRIGNERAQANRLRERPRR